jgi:uncharacterized protein with PhoU and TrkA domain
MGSVRGQDFIIGSSRGALMTAGDGLITAGRVAPVT